MIAVFLLLILIMLALTIAGTWKTYQKLGKPGWASLIPIYSQWTLGSSVCTRTIALAFTALAAIFTVLYVLSSNVSSGILMALYSLVAIVYIVATVLITYGLALAFNQGVAFCVGLVLLPFIFFPLLGFSDKYQPNPNTYNESNLDIDSRKAQEGTGLFTN